MAMLLCDIPPELLTNVCFQSSGYWDDWVSTFALGNKVLRNASRSYLNQVIEDMCFSMKREVVAWKGDLDAVPEDLRRLPPSPFLLGHLKVLRDAFKGPTEIPKVGDYGHMTMAFATEHGDIGNVIDSVTSSNCLQLIEYQGVVSRTPKFLSFSESDAFSTEMTSRFPFFGNALYHFKLPVRSSHSIYDPEGQSLVSLYLERHELKNIDFKISERLDSQGWVIAKLHMHSTLAWQAIPKTTYSLHTVTPEEVYSDLMEFAGL